MDKCKCLSVIPQQNSSRQQPLRLTIKDIKTNLERDGYSPYFDKYWPLKFYKAHHLIRYYNYNLSFLYLSPQSASSPRRVAVPVLVKDGKPCSGGSNNPSSQTGSGQSGHNSSSQQQQQQQQQLAAAVHAQQQSVAQLTSGNSSSLGSNGSNLLTVNDPTHSPDPSSVALLTYNGATAQHSQMLQQPGCNNALMSNSLAMAYRNQNNFMSSSHQQQCSSYLPLQGRAW